MSTSPSPQPFLTRPLPALLLLALLATLIYSNTFSIPFYFDDYRNIVDNPRVKDLSNFLDFSSGTRDIGFLSFALNYYFGGLKVFGYHLINLITHIANGFLVYSLVLLLFRAVHGSPSTADSDPQRVSVPWIALATALLFISHPIQTQAVTYIVQRFASLVTLFYLSTMVFYLKWRLSPAEGKTRYVWYVAALLMTVLAMKTKENSFTVPLMILLVEFVFFRPFNKKRWLVLTPFLLTLAIIPLSNVNALGEAEGFARDTTKITRLDYLVTQFRVIVTYLRVLVLPINQNLDYDYPVFHSLFAPPVFVSFLFLSFLFGVAVYLLRHTREPSSFHSQRKLIAFGILWFFLALSVESSIIPIKDVIFEHRMYLPAIGIFLATATGILNRSNYEKSFRIPTGKVAALGCIVLVFSVAAYHRNRVWQDPQTLWNDVVKKSPKKGRGYNNLGKVYQEKGQSELAVENFLMALKLLPDFVEVYDNLGIVYARQARWEDAIRMLQKAVNFKSDEYNHISYVKLGDIYNRLGRTKEAVESYERAIDLQPTDVDTRFALGNLYLANRQTQEAINQFQQVIGLIPKKAEAHMSLGLAYLQNDKLEQAAQALQTAVGLQPNLAGVHTNLGNVFRRQGKANEAIQEYKIAIFLNPRDLATYYNLGLTYRNLKRFDEARMAFERTLEIDPNFKLARDALSSLDE